jgi:type IV fimbrial biogenesis protein FimT
MTESQMIFPIHDRHWRLFVVRGFTLVEMMVVITVLAILLAIAAPSFDTLVKNNRLASASSEVQSALSLARNEAVTRRQFVTVCPSADGASCSGDWGSHNGVIVFADNGTPGVVGSQQIFKIIQFDPSIKITPNNTTRFNGKPYIRFDLSGTLDGNGSNKGGTLKFCDSRTGDFGRYLRVLPAGTTQAERQRPCS